MSGADDVEDRVKRVLLMMREQGIQGEIIRHPLSGKTTERAEAALGQHRSNILKCLILLAGEKRLGVIVAGDSRVDLEKLECVSGLKRLRLARADEVRQLVGFDIGGIPPFALGKVCPVYVDLEVMQRSFVVGAAGTEYAGVKFDPSQLTKLGYTVEDIAG